MLGVDASKSRYVIAAAFQELGKEELKWLERVVVWEKWTRRSVWATDFRVTAVGPQQKAMTESCYLGLCLLRAWLLVLSADWPRQSEKLMQIRPICLLEGIMNPNLLPSRSRDVVFRRRRLYTIQVDIYHA